MCKPLDLSTPEATVLGYCFGAGKNVSEYFDYPVDPQIFGIGWIHCKIVEIKRTNEVGKKYGSKLIVEENDMEVIAEVRQKKGKGSKEFLTRYSYLLRKFGDKWKIVSHSHIPDKNFPY